MFAKSALSLHDMRADNLVSQWGVSRAAGAREVFTLLTWGFNSGQARENMSWWKTYFASLCKYYFVCLNNRPNTSLHLMLSSGVFLSSSCVALYHHSSPFSTKMVPVLFQNQFYLYHMSKHWLMQQYHHLFAGPEQRNAYAGDYIQRGRVFGIGIIWAGLIWIFTHLILLDYNWITINWPIIGSN